MGLASALRRSFVSGILLVTPLVVTLFVLSLVFGWLTDLIDPIVRTTRLRDLTANDRLLARVLAVGIVAVALTTVGFVAQRGFGRRLFGSLGRTMDLVPLVSVVYGGIRQVATALAGQRSNYDDVVFVEYPREGIYAVGFVTGETRTPAGSADGPLHTVYLPNSPNPTQGRLVFVPAEQLHEVDMTVRQAINTIVTTGIGKGESGFRGEEPPVRRL